MHHATLLEDGRVLVSDGFAGVANNNVVFPLPREDFQIYDVETEEWSLITPNKNRAILSTTVGLSDDRYMSVGIGVNEEGEPIPNAGILDASTHSWTPLPPPELARGVPRMAPLADGRVLIAGGIDFKHGSQLGSMLEAEIFDPRTEVWQRVAPMNTVGGLQSIVSLEDGRVMIIKGGIKTAEMYNPTTDSWTQTTPSSISTQTTTGDLRPSVVILEDGRVLVTGAIPIGVEIPIDNDVMRYDEDTGKWVAIHTDTSEDIEYPKVSAEIYDPATDTWTITEPMNSVRTSHTLTMLGDGRVLAAGGEGLSYLELHFSTEIFDPDTNEWSPGPEMSEPRYDHTATLLPDGRIFIFGGVTIREDIQEIYPTYTSEFITVPDSP